VEDGFLRSLGLGASLTPPLSLVTDQTGIYYDPRAASDLELLIKGSVDLPQDAIDRAERLRKSIIQAGLSKYNLDGQPPTFDAEGREVILIAGQVEDDASVVHGATDIKTTADLVTAVRRDFPDAFLIYKPHPDVESGNRKGAVSPQVLAEYIDELPAQTFPSPKPTHVYCRCCSIAFAGSHLFGGVRAWFARSPRCRPARS